MKVINPRNSTLENMWERMRKGEDEERRRHPWGVTGLEKRASVSVPSSCTSVLLTAVPGKHAQTDPNLHGTRGCSVSSTNGGQWTGLLTSAREEELSEKLLNNQPSNLKENVVRNHTIQRPPIYHMYLSEESLQCGEKVLNKLSIKRCQSAWV